MIPRPSVLCPVDFSESARGALRYAAATAAHFGACLTLLYVADPLVEAVSDGLTLDARSELEQFFRETFRERPHEISEVRLEVRAGKPALEIVRASHQAACDLIIMSSHGLTGVRKVFFGSTTERVLRETTVPVLVTPADDNGPDSLEGVSNLIRRVLVPIDFSSASAHQLRIAQGLAEAMAVPIVLLHVVEPPWMIGSRRSPVSEMDAERRHQARQRLAAAARELPRSNGAETLIADGDPAEQIAKAAVDRDAGIIVMGLHSSVPLGPRMGSVTYKVLCRADKLVLALPPLAKVITVRPDATTANAPLKQVSA
jgi:universal stress protein E